MAAGIKTTVKKFEQMLFEKHGVTEKSEHIENGWGDGGPMITKLWLYHINGKHVGTYNRKARVANLIE
jgi:hypothetical protein